MSFNRILGLGLLIIGIVLLVFGVRSTETTGEQVVNAVQGRYTANTMWYLIGGGVMVVVGAALAFMRRFR